MNKTILQPYTSEDRQGFTDMMCDYFENDLGDEISPSRMPIVVMRIEYEMSLYPMYVNILTNNGQPIGFIIFQIDTPENPWGLKPGWGFIREMYIHRDFRRRGLGKSVVDEVFKFLQSRGVRKFYLTADSDGSQKFWQELGFSDSGEVCEKNGLKIYSK